MSQKNIVITGTGAYIPTEVRTNAHFVDRKFYNMDGSAITNPGAVVVKKFQDITGIVERRYVTDNLNSSKIAAKAAKIAIADAGIDQESIDQIILAHNFGDVRHDSAQGDVLPCLASRVKHELGIRNPNCVAYDILFGCPGWLQGVIQGHAFMKAGQAKRILVVGSETLSRVVDPFDRDSMIYSDGAGATVMEFLEEDEKRGVYTHGSKSYTYDEAYYLFWGKSYLPESKDNTRYIKMHGRKIYEFALSAVPSAMKECLDASGFDIKDLKKIFIHQANEKMDEAIIKRFYKLYDIDDAPEGVMPMSIHKLGNSSVATVPTLYHMVRKGEMPEHNIKSGDLVMFASVGAGMHVNAMTYVV